MVVWCPGEIATVICQCGNLVRYLVRYAGVADGATVIVLTGSIAWYDSLLWGIMWLPGVLGWHESHCEWEPL